VHIPFSMIAISISLYNRRNFTGSLHHKGNRCETDETSISTGCAFLHPDEIPEMLFMEGASELGPVLQPVAQDEFALSAAIAELRRYSHSPSFRLAPLFHVSTMQSGRPKLEHHYTSFNRQNPENCHCYFIAGLLAEWIPGADIAGVSSWPIPRNCTDSIELVVECGQFC